MGEVPPPNTGKTVRVPVPRDPPPPPGYVDPLDGVGALDDLVPDDLPDPDDQSPTRTSEQQSPST